MTSPLGLHEEVLLLALKDEKGTLAGAATYYQSVIGGAILAELLIAKKIRNDDSKKQLLDITDRNSLGDKILGDGLCEKGVLRREDVKILGLFNSKRYPELAHEPERQLVARLERAIFSDDSDVDLRTAMLISLMQTALIVAAVVPAIAISTIS